MMQRLFFPLLLLVIGACGCNGNTDKANTDTTPRADTQRSTDSSTMTTEAARFIDTTDYLKLPETNLYSETRRKNIRHLGRDFENEKKLPELKLQKISKAEFTRYKNAYKSVLDTSHRYLAFETDSFFALRPTTEIYKLNKETNKDFGNRDGYSWFEYDGYVPGLKMYVLNHGSVGESIGFSTRYLLDSASNMLYSLESAGDGGAEVPVFSPGFSYVACYANGDYTPDCIIYVAKIERQGNQNTFKTIVFTAADWVTKEIVWIDDTSFAIQIAKEDDKPTYRNGYPIQYPGYFKVKLP